MPGMFLSQMKK